MNLTTQQEKQLRMLQALFLEWNQKINLSAIRAEEDIWTKHIEDSLLAIDRFDFNQPRILDLGTGGGFPVLPLAIMFPDSNFECLDSVGKKMKAVQAMADSLELKLKAHHGRIEDFGQDKKYREKFDLVTARALAPWPVLLEYSLPFVKVGGSFLAYQGPQIEADLVTFKYLERNLGAQIKRVEKMTLGEAERVFVEVEKISKTPRIYPRMNGLPRQKPLTV